MNDLLWPSFITATSICVRNSCVHVNNGDKTSDE